MRTDGESCPRHRQREPVWMRSQTKSKHDHGRKEKMPTTKGQFGQRVPWAKQDRQKRSWEGVGSARALLRRAGPCPGVMGSPCAPSAARTTGSPRPPQVVRSPGIPERCRTRRQSHGQRRPVGTKLARQHPVYSSMHPGPPPSRSSRTHGHGPTPLLPWSC